jgi:transposase
MVCIKAVMHIMNDRVTRGAHGRREHSPELKRELVARSLLPGASVSAIALEAGINANLLFTGAARTASRQSTPRGRQRPCCCRYRSRRHKKSNVVAPTPAPPESRPATGSIEIDIAGSRVRLRGVVDEATLRCILHSAFCILHSAVAARRRMIGAPANTRVCILAGHTDMRKGFDGLAAMVQTALAANPFCGHVIVFRGRRGDILKVLWFDGQGLMLLSKRLERGRFVWPQAASGSVSLTPPQLSMLLEGIDWRMPMRTREPKLAA